MNASSKDVRLRFSMLRIFVFTTFAAVFAALGARFGLRSFAWYSVPICYLFTPTLVAAGTTPFEWGETAKRVFVLKFLLVQAFVIWFFVGILWLYNGHPTVSQVVGASPFLAGGHCLLTLYFWLPQYLVIVSCFED